MVLSSTQDNIQHKVIEDLFTTCLDKNIQQIKKTFKSNPYLTFRQFIFAEEIHATLVYLDGMVEIKYIQEFLLQSSLRKNPVTFPVFGSTEFISFIHQNIFTIGKIQITSNFKEAIEAILSGNSIILFQNQNIVCILSTQGGIERSISEPTSQNVIRGPRDGFTESLHTNISLLLKRIKTPELSIIKKTLGTHTHTDINVVYHAKLVDSVILRDVLKRIENIKVESILESAQMEPYLLDPSYSPFPTIYHTERPDIIATGILDGRIAIIVDGTPFVLLLPTMFQHFLHANEDVYQFVYFSIFIRILRYFSFFGNILIPSVFIALTCFHQEMIPLPLFVSLASQRNNLPFPPLIELILMEGTFEVLREAGIRLPRAAGSAISIVGALVIGESAVQAGLVSSATIIVVALTAIMSFVTPLYAMSLVTRLARFIFLFLASIWGLYGIMIGIFILLIHLCDISSVGQPYFGDYCLPKGIIRSPSK
ncbi:spore germination protein [Bacillus thuringiensis]|uniref:spore germination protein n=1 Tax=Bacillus TaxID=1386 RepID=UPI0012DD0BDB|nr:spore germination protein [Bacillus thuringiensis]